MPFLGDRGSSKAELLPAIFAEDLVIPAAIGIQTQGSSDLAWLSEADISG